MNVLIVEDELLVAQSLKKIIEDSFSHCFVSIATNYEESWGKLLNKDYHIALIDIMLGADSLDGLELCKQMKERSVDIPIIFVTCCTSIKYLERAFELGAYDYISKPYNARELSIRVKRWGRAPKPQAKSQETSYSSLVYEPKKNQFLYKNHPLKSLTPKNKRLLSLFINNPETLLTKSYLIENYWGDHSTSTKNRNLRSAVQSLRGVLESEGIEWIRTVRGEGYILKK